MNNNHKKTNSVEKELLSTKTPINFYLVTITISAFFIFFIFLALIHQINPWSASISFLFFAGFIYTYFGRYLAKIKLYNHHVEIQYLFPWNDSVNFSFNHLVEFEHKAMPWLSWHSRWYRSYHWLYLKNEEGKVCQIRYNINANDAEKLLAVLKNQLS